MKPSPLSNDGRLTWALDALVEIFSAAADSQLDEDRRRLL
jgi:hypothetical protein